MNHTDIHTGSWKYGARLLLVLVAGIALTSCATLRQENARSSQKFLQEAQDPKMRELWRTAQAEGKLPPFEAIPTPERRVERRSPAVIVEPPAQPRRPVIPPSTVADAQLFLPKPIAHYEGTFRVTRHEPGLLVGAIKGLEEALELHYKLPGEKLQIAVPERAELMMTLREEVVDSALQRRVILRTEQATTPFIYIAEGSGTPYRLVVDALDLTIEQVEGRGDGHPPVRITYGERTVTLEEGERKRIGEGERAVEAYLQESIAMSPQKAMLQEGQPFYIALMIYRTR